jgi:hypothetical protein
MAQGLRKRWQRIRIRNGSTRVAVIWLLLRRRRWILRLLLMVLLLLLLLLIRIGIAAYAVGLLLVLPRNVDFGDVYHDDSSDKKRFIVGRWCAHNDAKQVAFCVCVFGLGRWCFSCCVVPRPSSPLPCHWGAESKRRSIPHETLYSPGPY